ncbi:helix-turn-helix transcriptional regulator [Rheinheimera sp. UJ63]|uniref:helix-turn-helix transcriptional regulator n=1 Tax=Rheinheimera sp. UJ63 TaxID=2910157 RepID=UPI001F2CEE6A|nr:WYL domain-containing protein [Rheinheimera sp. UJ63]MCF4009590.1 WYL domain-containing protein [Rheinheimera sp. UJ63]
MPKVSRIDLTKHQVFLALPEKPANPISLKEIIRRLSTQHKIDDKSLNSRILEQFVRRKLDKLLNFNEYPIYAEESARPVLYGREKEPVKQALGVLAQLSYLNDKVTRFLPIDQQAIFQNSIKQNGVDRWQQYIYVAPSAVWRSPDYNAEALRVLYSAIENQHPIAFDYLNMKGQAKRKQLMPWGLMFKAEKIYLLGVEGQLDIDKPASYAVHRMENLTPLPMELKYRGKPDTKTLTQICEEHEIGLFSSHRDKKIALELKFYGDAARYIDETPLSDDQKVISLADDCRILKATVRDCYELRKFIRGFGVNVEVLAPAELRAEITAELQALLKRYADI